MNDLYFNVSLLNSQILHGDISPAQSETCFDQVTLIMKVLSLTNEQLCKETHLLICN